MKSTLNVNKATAYFYTIAYFFTVVLSLTLLYPYAYCKYHGWLINHSEVNGKKLEFRGKVKELYKVFFIGLVLGIAIYLAYVGIYTGLLNLLLDNNVKIDYFSMNRMSVKIVSMLPSILVALLINARFYKFKAVNTHFVDEDDKSGLKLQLVKILLSSIIFKVILVATTFIGYPFALNIRERFMASRRYIDKQDLKFSGSIGKICGIWFLGIVLTVLTLFLYLPYLYCKLQHYIIINTSLKNEECLN